MNNDKTAPNPSEGETSYSDTSYSATLEYLENYRTIEGSIHEHEAAISELKTERAQLQDRSFKSALQHGAQVIKERLILIPDTNLIATIRQDGSVIFEKAIFIPQSNN